MVTTQRSTDVTKEHPMRVLRKASSIAQVSRSIEGLEREVSLSFVLDSVHAEYVRMDTHN
jgi:hypothetical protein